MLEAFKDYLKNENLITPQQKILLGVSGGIDSMVMLELFLRAGFNIIVAHCNFGLRGDESDRDEEFVRNHCHERNIPFYSKRFDTEDHAKTLGISPQMAARELRYKWFSGLLKETGAAYVAIAHNRNDLAETFILNICRGTGIMGLTGMGSKSASVIRPLLFASREEIEKFAEKEGVTYHEDSSNREVKYHRNRIRNRVIPELEKINPSFITTAYENTLRIKEAAEVYNQAITEKFHLVCRESGEEAVLKVDKLLQLTPLHVYLYEFLKKWSFSPGQVPDIIDSLDSAPGRMFFSPTHRLVKDRDHLLVTPLKSEGEPLFYIEEGTNRIEQPLQMTIKTVEADQGFRIPSNANIACLDADLLHFPLIIRKWRKGDYFQPLGMTGMKKVSDFFVDNKFSLVEKEAAWIIASGNKIAWIAGHRIDNRFRITSHTRRIVMLEITG